MTNPLISILMGNRTDWETMHIAARLLHDFGVAYDVRDNSLHRLPKPLLIMLWKWVSREYDISSPVRVVRRILLAVTAGQTTLADLFAIDTLALNDTQLVKRLI